jgi:hypothetical protein
MFPFYNDFLDGQESQMPGRVLPRASRVLSGNNGVTQDVAAGSALGGGYEQQMGRLLTQSTEAMDRYRQMRDRPVDYTQLQELAKQRGIEGEDAMLNALAAQFAGPQYQGLQGALLKRSMATRDPIKTARGMVTAEGGFVADPDALRADEIQRAGEDARFYDQQYGRVVDASERAQQRRDEIRRREEERASDRQWRATQAELDRRARGDNARALAGNAAGNRLATLEDRLADDYRNETKDARKIIGTFDNLKSTPVTAAGDISFIFQYMKMLDPTSVVREGEFATAQNAAGIPDQVMNLYNRAIQGTRLNPQQREQFLATAGSLAKNAESSLLGVQRHYGEVAQRRGLDARNIFDRGGPGSTPVRVNY